MKVFAPLYERALRWAQHRNAPVLLGVLSFVEAVFFPVMPEVMLAPMALSRPQRAFRYATISLACSLAGALVGYALGHYAYELVKPAFASLGWAQHVDEQVAYLRGIAIESPWKAFWILVLAGFAPIPLKFFTWASGIVGVPLLPFMASMFIGRGKRVYLLALAIRIGGPRAEAALRRWIEPLGWIALLLLVAVFGWLAWRAYA
ncbi:MAG TPA: YqaA family protein [Luteimonas sp.]|nr:YqaA family protein [Luteimonas sp.]